MTKIIPGHIYLNSSRQYVFVVSRKDEDNIFYGYVGDPYEFEYVLPIKSAELYWRKV